MSLIILMFVFQEYIPFSPLFLVKCFKMSVWPICARGACFYWLQCPKAKEQPWSLGLWELSMELVLSQGADDAGAEAATSALPRRRGALEPGFEGGGGLAASQGAQSGQPREHTEQRHCMSLLLLL